MTIWDWLHTDHRRSNCVQKVQPREKASKKGLKGAREVAQIKDDGVYCLICNDRDTNRADLFSRTGKAFTNIPTMLRQSAWHKFQRGIYPSELCCDTLSLEELSGAVNPNRVIPYDWKDHKPYFVVREMLFFHEFIAGYSPDGYLDRNRRLKTRMSLNSVVREVKFLRPPGKNVSAHFSEWDCQETENYAINELGAEGVVYSLVDGDWKAGRKNYVQTKVVKGVDYDLRVLGVEVGAVGTKRHGQVTNLLVAWRPFGDRNKKGVTLSVDLGKGWTDEKRIELFNNPLIAVGKIVHVHALSVGSKGSLRLPKAEEIRADKDYSDFEEEAIAEVLALPRKITVEDFTSRGIPRSCAHMLIFAMESDDE